MLPLTFTLASIHAEIDDEEGFIKRDYYSGRISMAEMRRRLQRTNKIRQLVHVCEEHCEAEPFYSADRDTRGQEER